MTAPAPATARDTLDAPALGGVGGVGGTLFRKMCPPDAWLIGIRFRDGAWIDAVAPVSSRCDSATVSGPSLRQRLPWR